LGKKTSRKKGINDGTWDKKGLQNRLLAKNKKKTQVRKKRWSFLKERVEREARMTSDRAEVEKEENKSLMRKGGPHR